MRRTVFNKPRLLGPKVRGAWPCIERGGVIVDPHVFLVRGIRVRKGALLSRAQPALGPNPVRT